MVWVYGLVLAVGFLMLLAWIVGAAIAAWVDGWEFTDPERRFGRSGRSILAGAIGFGMAGMSATFAGWHWTLGLAAAVAGAAALVAVARVFEPAQA